MKAIGNFANGTAEKNLVLEKERIQNSNVVFIENFALPDDKWDGDVRSEIRFTGYIENDKPVTNSYAQLQYKWAGHFTFSDEGCFNDKLILSGIGKRDFNNGDYKQIGHFNTAGLLHGNALSEDADGTDTEFGSFLNDDFHQSNPSLDNLGADTFKLQLMYQL